MEKKERDLEVKKYTRKEFAEFLDDISSRAVDGKDNLVQSVVAINHLLRRPEAPSCLDEELKSQARDLWLRFKSRGSHLVDPPLLFDDASPVLEITTPAKRGSKRQGSTKSGDGVLTEEKAGQAY